MGDNLKLSKDKRHRSSSSLAGNVLDGTFSERKLDIKASIPEGDDQFAIAEARCEDLQEKIDLVKILKRKRKLKRRSTTRVTEPQESVENVPFISVRTQPKTKVSQQVTRLRRLDTPSIPIRGHLDPARLEQHRMISKDAEMNSNLRVNRQMPRARSGRACGDGTCGQGVQITTHNSGDATRDGVVTEECSDDGPFEQQRAPRIRNKMNSERKRPTLQGKIGQWKRVPKTLSKEDGGMRDNLPDPRRRQQTLSRLQHQQQQMNQREQNADRAVVELFNKNRGGSSQDSWQGNIHTQESYGGQNKVRDTLLLDEPTRSLEDCTPMEEQQEAEVQRPARRIRYPVRRNYELPTVASRMKRNAARLYAATTNTTNIPFIVSKSTAPSHNIGVNIQQVLNGLKTQQPLTGIPMTIAHHMGLGHIPTQSTKSAHATSMLESRDINSIRLGSRLLRLPMYKYMSYSRLLNLFREGDGMVPRFLRAISRPHYFYTSMYNLVTNLEDVDGTSKGGGQAARQSLAEYANLYREYEEIEKSLKTNGYEPNLGRRRDDLQRELALKEEHIRKVVHEYENGAGTVSSTLRASTSVADEGYRQSTYKLNAGDALH